MFRIIRKLEQMALDLSSLTSNTEALSNAIQSLTDLTSALAAEQANAAAAAAAQVSADEAAATAALSQVSDHLGALVNSINVFVAQHQPPAAPAADPAPAA